MISQKRLSHIVPSWIDPRNEVYFITVNCRERFRNQLATDEVSEGLFETIRHRQEQSLWWPHLFLLMPDHAHGLISFPSAGKSFRLIISKWKEWTAKRFGILWQADFFERRLRGEESRREKAAYIFQNPVRKGLVGAAEEWPFVYFASGQRPEFGD